MAQLIGSLAVIFLFFGIIYGCEEASCENKSKMMGFKYNYAANQGCMIKVKDQWIPINQYRVLE